MTLRHTILMGFGLAFSLLAQKKPITLESLKQRPMGEATLSPVWAPNGYQFAYSKTGGLFLYDCRARQSRQIFAKFSDLAALAIKDSHPDLAFGWQNRISANVAGIGRRHLGGYRQRLIHCFVISIKA